MVNATGPSYKFASILFDFKTAIKSSCILVSRTTAYGSSFQFFEYLFIILFNTNLDLVNDQENTSLYDTFVDSCFTNPKNVHVLYRKQAGGDQKAYKHWLLRSIQGRI